MKPATELKYRRQIAKVIAEIAAEPAADHTIESLSSIAQVSPFHFHRTYRSVTGEGLAATVRRVRLARASDRLNAVSSSVIITALEVGYDSPQSFARAFRQFTGLTPSIFQTRQTLLRANASIQMVSLPSMIVYGIWHEGSPATIPHTFQRLRTWIVDSGYASSSVERIGISLGDPEQPTRYCYFAAVSFADEGHYPIGLLRREISGSTYAVYRHIGPYVLISPTVQSLIGGWLPQSGLELADRPLLEIYRNNPGNVAAENLVTDLCIPVIGHVAGIKRTTMRIAHPCPPK